MNVSSGSGSSLPLSLSWHEVEGMVVAAVRAPCAHGAGRESGLGAGTARVGRGDALAELPVVSADLLAVMCTEVMAAAAGDPQPAPADMAEPEDDPAFVAWSAGGAEYTRCHRRLGRVPEEEAATARSRLAHVQIGLWTARLTVGVDGTVFAAIDVPTGALDPSMSEYLTWAIGTLPAGQLMAAAQGGD